MVRLLLRLGLCLLCLGSLHTKALAGPYDDGLEAYEAGEYGKAYKLLGKAAKKAKSKSSQADALALMGAAAAKLGKKEKAASLFAQAKRKNPEVELPGAAAKDKTVKKLFAKGKGAMALTGDSEDEDDEKSDGDSGKKKGGRKKPKFSDVNNYLPFGINQYLKNKTILAGVFGGGQALGLFLYFDRQRAITAANADASAAFEEYSAKRAPTAQDTSDLLEFLDGNATFVKAAQRDAQVFLLLTIASYGLSVYESLYEPFAGTSLGGGKKSASLDELDSDPASREGWVLEERKLLEPGRAPGSSYDLQILPSTKPLLMLSLSNRF